jgi:hypothetical protein
MQEQAVDLAGDELVFDSLEASRAFRVPRPHLMPFALRM